MLWGQRTTARCFASTKEGCARARVGTVPKQKNEEVHASTTQGTAIARKLRRSRRQWRLNRLGGYTSNEINTHGAVLGVAIGLRPRTGIVALSRFSRLMVIFVAKQCLSQRSRHGVGCVGVWLHGYSSAYTDN